MLWLETVLTKSYFLFVVSEELFTSCLKGGQIYQHERWQSGASIMGGVISDLECKKSGCRGVAGRVSGENRGKSRARQTGSMVMFGTTTVLGD